MQSRQLWSKNGNILMQEGKIILCENCPCEPCELELYLSGWDHDRTSTSEPTHHIFKVSLEKAVIKSLKFGYDSTIVDLGGIIRQTGPASFIVELDNKGTGSDDSYDFHVELTLVGAPVSMESITVEHRFAGSAQSSEYAIELSGNCLDDEEFE